MDSSEQLSEKQLKEARKAFREARDKGSALLKCESREEALKMELFLRPYLQNESNTNRGLDVCIIRNSEINLYSVTYYAKK